MDQLGQATAVFAVLVLLGVVLYVLRSKGLVQFAFQRSRPVSDRKLQSIERLPLTAQHSLHLVRVAGRIVLIAVSPGGCSVLDGGWEDQEHERGFVR